MPRWVMKRVGQDSKTGTSTYKEVDDDGNACAPVHTTGSIILRTAPNSEHIFMSVDVAEETDLAKNPFIATKFTNPKPESKPRQLDSSRNKRGDDDDGIDN
jgi:hypothetical protein